MREWISWKSFSIQLTINFGQICINLNVNYFHDDLLIHLLHLSKNSEIDLREKCALLTLFVYGLFIILCEMSTFFASHLFE